MDRPARPPPLSILDLSPAGAQPMVDPATGHVHVVFNGEIYNYVALRERLAAEGQRVAATRSHADVHRQRMAIDHTGKNKHKRAGRPTPHPTGGQVPDTSAERDREGEPASAPRGDPLTTEYRDEGRDDSGLEKRSR